MKAIAEALKAKINEVKSEIESLEAKAALLEWRVERYEVEREKTDLEFNVLRNLRKSLVSIYKAMQIEVDTFKPENHEL